MAKRKQVAGLAPVVREKAVKVLQDPRVQQLILEHAQDLVEPIKKLGPALAQRVESVTERFGQSGLERRAAALSRIVADLSSESDELRVALQPVRDAMNEVQRMLVVSANLPFLKRQKAHTKIDDVLDELEVSLFEATLPSQHRASADE